MTQYVRHTDGTAHGTALDMNYTRVSDSSSLPTCNKLNYFIRYSSKKRCSFNVSTLKNCVPSGAAQSVLYVSGLHKGEILFTNTWARVISNWYG